MKPPLRSLSRRTRLKTSPHELKRFLLIQFLLGLKRWSRARGDVELEEASLQFLEHGVECLSLFALGSAAVLLEFLLVLEFEVWGETGFEPGKAVLHGSVENEEVVGIVEIPLF